MLTLDILYHYGEYFLFAPSPDPTSLPRPALCQSSDQHEMLFAKLLGLWLPAMFFWWNADTGGQSARGGRGEELYSLGSLSSSLSWGAKMFFQRSGLLGATPSPTACCQLWALGPFCSCSPLGLPVLTPHPFNCFQQPWGSTLFPDDFLKNCPHLYKLPAY